jgi:hypothetical protein
MKKHSELLTTLCVFAGLSFGGLGFAGPSIAVAQEQPGGITPPPKVLVLQREFLKPGKAGSAHEKSESAFVQAMKQANAPEHYFAVNSLSGKSRTVFFIGYDSFADWQKDMDSMMKNTTLAQQFDSAQEADGELLSSYDSGAFVYREDLSLRAPVDIAHMRYMEITIFNVRPGHRHDWETLAKMYNDAWQKVAGAHWATYEKLYGADSGGMYLVITPMKSLAEVDQEMVDDKQFTAGMSAEDRKKMGDLSASTIKSDETNLFLFDPKMSYVPDNWKNADPGFWGQQ